jgi:hypothetical protein
MSEAPGAVWFYTRQGMQVGPVAFTELQEKARAGEIDPRHDMAWNPGMADWKAAGEIPDLFEKLATPGTHESLASTADPYTPPRQGGAGVPPGPDGTWPGARRRSFYLMTMLFPFIWMAGLGAATPLLQQQFGAEITGMLTLGAMVVPWILAIWFGLLRLTNLGMSRWWYLGNLVPILNLWVGYRLYVCPAGYAFHRKLDAPGVVLAIFYWLMILFMVLMVITFIAMLTGMFGSPEIRQQLEEALRNLPRQTS